MEEDVSDRGMEVLIIPGELEKLFRGEEVEASKMTEVRGRPG